MRISKTSSARATTLFLICVALIGVGLAQDAGGQDDPSNPPPDAGVDTEPCLEGFDVPLEEFYRVDTGDMLLGCAGVGTTGVGTSGNPPEVTLQVEGTPIEAWIYWIGETRAVGFTNGAPDYSVTLERLEGASVVDTREILGVEVGRRNQLFSDETAGECEGDGGEVVMRGLVPLDVFIEGTNVFRLPFTNCLSCFNEKTVFCNGADRAIYRRQFGFAIEVVVDGGESRDVEIIALEGGDYASRGPNSRQPNCDPAQTMTELTCFDFEALECDASAELSFIAGGLYARVNVNGDLSSQEETLFGSSSGAVGPSDLSQIEMNKLIDPAAFFLGDKLAIYQGTHELSEGDTQACFKVDLLPPTADERFPQELILAKASLVIDRSCPPQTASLGDRVWEDFDGDGVQDCEDTNGNGKLGDVGDLGSECLDAAVPDVPVELFATNDAGECIEPTGRSTTTDAEGFYLFEDLDPGNYCVRFDIGGLEALCVTGAFDLGAPVFTRQNIGEESRDSDASGLDGRTETVSLMSGDFNRTLDGGIVCPVKIGDRVWIDENGNGVQDEGEDNLEGVAVRLFECGLDGIPGTDDDVDTGETRVTAADGMYMFGAEPAYVLPPGEYFVRFEENTLPAGAEFTSPKQGSNDAVDSDCMIPGGRTACTDLSASRSINLDRDCGVLTANCDLRLDARCRVEPQPSSMPGQCKGRLQEFTVIWSGVGEIQVSVVNGSGTSADGQIVRPGDAVTVFGPFADNDVVLDISGDVTGQSEFHTSCSDDDFNGPEDCGAAAGNGKSDDASLINDWQLEGFVDAEGQVLDCTPEPSSAPFTDACIFTSSPRPSCDTTGKPETLTWRYDGGTGGDGDCADSTFATAVDDDGDTHKDFVCSGAVDVDAAVTAVDKDGVSRSVGPGEEFTVPLRASEELMLSNAGGTQSLEFHTSCSQPIQVGLTAGSLTLAAMDAERGSRTVTYRYVVANEGSALSDVSLTDTELGCLAGEEVACDEAAFDLENGESRTFTRVAEIIDTTTSSATASAMIGSAICSASDSVTIEVAPPRCAASAAFKDLSDDAVKFTLTNTSETTATLNELTLDFPESLGNVKEVKLDGAIYKASESTLIVGPGDTVGSTDWTEPDVNKRELDPGEHRTLEIKFSRKDEAADWLGLGESLGIAAFLENCEATLPGIPSCEAGKPTELLFDVTGEDCSATTNPQEGAYKCTDDGPLGALLDVVMTKDADKISAEIVGGQVRIVRSDHPGEKFPSEIKFRLEGSTGSQAHTIHTSCSKELEEGDHFGGLILNRFTPEF